MVLPNLPPTDAEGNRRVFSIASPPQDTRRLVITTRMTGTAFTRSLAEVSLGTPVDLSGPAGTFGLHWGHSVSQHPARCREPAPPALHHIRAAVGRGAAARDCGLSAQPNRRDPHHDVLSGGATRARGGGRQDPERRGRRSGPSPLRGVCGVPADMATWGSGQARHGWAGQTTRWVSAEARG